MGNEIVKINASDYGLEDKKVKSVGEAFAPKIAERDELNKLYVELIKGELTPELSEEAGELRRKLVKVRTGISDIHKTQKAFYLASGKYVDAWKNKETVPVVQMEEKLAEIEKYVENLAKEEQKKIQEDRKTELIEYMEEGTDLPENLGEMPEEIWLGFLKGMKANYQERVAEEEKEEASRIENERLDKIERERELELANYGDFIEDYPKELKQMSAQDYTDYVNSLKVKKEDKAKEDEKIAKENEQLKKENEEKEKAQKVKDDAAAKKLEEETKAKEKAEAENKRIADELQAKKDKETEDKAEEERLQQIELNKGDTAKFKDLIAELEEIKEKYEFKSKKNQEMFLGVQTLIGKTVTYIKEK